MSASRTSTGASTARGLLVAFLLAVLLPTSAALAQQPFDKLGAYAEMRTIAAELEALRGAAATEESALRDTELRARFAQLQSAMGGDDPTRMYEANASRPTPAPGALRGSGPTPPPGMTVATTSATNSTPTPIADVAVSTSTITIAGAGTYLWDVDLTTSIQHTFAADMDITLTSPAGTVVTLSTDNGAGNDNVFDGTFWDDDANPAGAVPYTTNNGVVTDHVYVNLTTATPLVAEEALGAFRGENPNGTWTLTVSDDLSGDTGSINAWTLDVFTFTAGPTPTTTPFTNSTPTPIADVAVSTSTITVAGAGTTITDIDLVGGITHTFAADMDITLTSPAGTVVTLSTDNGAGNDNVFSGTTWNDSANPAGAVPYTTNNGVTTDHAYVNLTLATPLVAEEAMSAFVGENPNGTWTLSVSDDLSGDIGSIDGWSLAITTGVAPCTITCPANVTQSNDPNQCGAVINYPAPTASAGCGTVTCTPAAGSFFPVGTTTTTCNTTAGPSCSFTNTVNDTQPPTTVCPANITTAATAATGAVITFAAPTASDNCPGFTTICAPASGSTFPIGTTTDTCTTTDASANTASCSFTGTVVSPDLAITKTSSATGAPVVGQTIVFTLAVNNSSTVAATGVSVVDTLPAPLTYVSNTCGATAAGQTVTWNPGTVAAGATVSCQITTQVSSPGAIANTATASSTTFDNNPGNNSGTVTLGTALAAVIPTLGVGGLVLLAALMLVVAYRRRTRPTR